VAASKESVVTNISAGGEARKFEEVIPQVFPGLEAFIERQINSMSNNICRCLEKKYGRLGELGIDAALDESGKLWLLEINGKPAKSCVHNSNSPELIHTAYSNIVKYFN
jgi:D-alanine-D-alanine ligase-like ATP-grasp enzyme